MAILSPGSVAPVFSLPTVEDRTFSLAAFRGRSNVLLLFLPAAFTPICSTELPALSALRDRFAAEANTEVVAITVDNRHANGQWARECGGNPSILLSDSNPHGQVSRAYGAWMPADSLSARATFIIGTDGRIKYSADAGKFGRRSIPDLLAIATRINGGQPVPSVPILRPLGIPVLYVSPTCPYCRNVLDLVAQLGIGHKVVIRTVGKDQVATRELLAHNPQGGVPLFVALDGRVFVGQPDVAAQLRALQ